MPPPISGGTHFLGRASLVARAVTRPDAYVGHAREAWALARLAVRYPLGWPDAGLRVPSFAPEVVHGRPVVLVHGFAHNRSGWYALERALAGAGYLVVDSFNHVPWRDDVVAVAERLADRVEAVRRLTGADRVHLVGHSLGGLVARWYVQELGGDRTVATADTIGTPHRGTAAAWGVPGRTAGQARPGSPLIRRLDAGGRRSPVRWVNYRSPSDLLVQPPSAAVLDHPDLDVVDVVVRGHGHLSLMLDPGVIGSVVDQLRTADGRAGGGTLSGLRRRRPRQGAVSHPRGAARVAKPS